jgi:hypothetical protein
MEASVHRWHLFPGIFPLHQREVITADLQVAEIHNRE